MKTRKGFLGFLALFGFIVLMALNVVGIVFAGQDVPINDPSDIVLITSSLMESSLEITLLITIFVFYIIACKKRGTVKSVVLSIVATVFALSFLLIRAAFVFGLQGFRSIPFIMTIIFLAVPLVFSVLTFIVKPANPKKKLLFAYLSLATLVLSSGTEQSAIANLLHIGSFRYLVPVIQIIFALAIAIIASRSVTMDVAKVEKVETEVKLVEEKKEEFVPQYWEENGMYFRNYE